MKTQCQLQSSPWPSGAREQKQPPAPGCSCLSEASQWSKLTVLLYPLASSSLTLNPARYSYDHPANRSLHLGLWCGSPSSQGWGPALWN